MRSKEEDTAGWPLGAQLPGPAVRVFSWAQCQVCLIYQGGLTLRPCRFWMMDFFFFVVSCGFPEDLLCLSQLASTLSDAPWAVCTPWDGPPASCPPGLQIYVLRTVHPAAAISHDHPPHSEESLHFSRRPKDTAYDLQVLFRVEWFWLVSNNWQNLSLGKVFITYSMDTAMEIGKIKVNFCW